MYREGKKFALSICANNYYESYETLLDFFQIPSLRNRRLFLSLCTFYCIKKSSFIFRMLVFCHQPFHNHIVGVAILIPFCNGLNFLSLIVLLLWNNLSLEAVTSNTLNILYHPYFWGLRLEGTSSSPGASVWKCLVVAIHNEVTGHLRKHPCGDRSQTPQWVKKSTSLRLLSHLQAPKLSCQQEKGVASDHWLLVWLAHVYAA